MYDISVNNWRREFARRLIRKIHPYIYDTHVIYGDGTLRVGERVGLANTLFNLSSGNISVGNRCVFGHNVMCLTGTHQFHRGKRVSLYSEFDDFSFGGGRVEVPTSGRDIAFQDGCFIGSGSIIIGPVNIGENSIICAGAVITRDLPPYSVAAGIPAKIIGDTRERFHEWLKTEKTDPC